MTSLEGVNSQNTLWIPHNTDKETTPWPTQQRRNGQDTVMDVTYTVKNMQTPPVAVLVQPNSNPHPQFHIPPILESGVDKKHMNRSHDNMTSVANIQVSPQNGLSVLPSSPVFAKTHEFMPSTYSRQRTTSNPPVLLEINREHHSPKSSESRRISSSQLLTSLTTAEATTRALNAAFQTQGQSSLPHKDLPADITATTVHGGLDSIPSQTSALEVQLNHSNLNDNLLRLTVVESKEHNEELNNKPMEHQGGSSSEAKAKDLREQPSIQSSPSRTAENTNTPKRYVLQAVVIDERPPHHTGLVSPKRRTSQVNSQSATIDELVPIIKTGPPKLRDVLIRTRRPKAETKILRSEEEIQQYLQASVAPIRFATENEAQAAIDATYTNVQILMAQWESRPRVQNIPKAPSIIYPASEPLERFVDGIESAFGPGALDRIPQKWPKRVPNQRNHAKYVYTSSELEESEIEQVSNFPAEEDESVDKDTTMEEEQPIAVPEVIQDGIEETMAREDGARVNGLGTLKRKLSASGDEDSRKHPRLQDGVPGAKSHRPGTWKIYKDVIAKWVASLEVLVKGKVKLDRQDLRKLHQMLKQIYTLKNALSVDDDSSPNLEISHLKSRIRQLSEMTAEDIPFNDDENIRHLAKKISRSWI